MAIRISKKEPIMFIINFIVRGRRVTTYLREYFSCYELTYEPQYVTTDELIEMCKLLYSEGHMKRRDKLLLKNAKGEQFEICGQSDVENAIRKNT